jgi:hypothetical protein
MTVGVEGEDKRKRERNGSNDEKKQFEGGEVSKAKREYTRGLHAQNFQDGITTERWKKRG